VKERAQTQRAMWVLCAAWAGVVILAGQAGFSPLVRQELASVDFRFRVRGPQPPAPEIVILAIDARSLEPLLFTEEKVALAPELALFQNFPFPRRLYAAVIDKLVAAGARVIALDLLFLKPTGDDAELKSAIAQHRDRVVLGSNFSDDGTQLLLPSPVVPEDIATETVAGYVNYWADADRFVRRAHYRMVASDLAGVSRHADEAPLLSFDALTVRKFDPGQPVPEAGTATYINFPGPPETFPNHPLYELFDPLTWERNLKNGAVFRDKIVLVGPGGNFQHDTRPTPFGSPREMPGVEIHAAAIATLLHGMAPSDAPGWLSIVTVLLLATLAAMILTTSLHPLLKLLVLAGIGLSYFGVTIAAFNTQRLVLAVAGPLWTVAGGGMLGIALQVVAEQLEKLRVRRTLERYVSKPVADEILRRGEEYASSLRGERRAVTILFSDIRGFTTISEQSDPVKFVEQLNEYFGAMVEIVMKHDGTLSKFIGDAIMALYGAPLSRGEGEDAWRAVATAYEMRSRLAELHRDWESRSLPLLKIGIGINHGDVVLGDIGSPQRMEYTVIGDPVNVASRVEGLNKDFGTDILLTESVYELVKEQVEAELAGETAVKGRERPVRIYKLKALRADG
jgi:adenylate cyclase